MALNRINKIHPFCPTGCMALEQWWIDILTSYGDITEEQMYKICIVDEKYHFIGVSVGQIFDTCVYYNTDSYYHCGNDVVCSGHLYGEITAGWPGNQVLSLVEALSQDEYKH
eukprot:UN23571